MTVLSLKQNKFEVLTENEILDAFNECDLRARCYMAKDGFQMFSFASAKFQ